MPHIHKCNAHSTHRSAHSVPDTEVQLHNCTYVHGQLGGSGVEICTIMSKSAKGISNPFTKVQTVSTVHKKMAGQLTIGQLLLSGHSINSLTAGHLKDRERPATMRCFFMFSYKINLHFQFVHGQRLF